MRWGRIVVLLTAATLWPSAAFAARGWLAWLEELSGPGPFSGIVVSAPVFCPHDGQISCADPASRKRLVVLSVGRLGSGDNLRFKDLPDTAENRREVNALQISGVYMFRMGALDLGAGAELLKKFSGEGFSAVYRFGLIPASVSIRPLALIAPEKHDWWKSLIRTEIQTSFVTAGFKGSDFGNSQTTFSTGPEFLTRAAVVIDFGSIVWR